MEVVWDINIIVFVDERPLSLEVVKPPESAFRRDQVSSKNNKEVFPGMRQAGS